MDAANLSFKRISLSVAFALLLPAAAYAQTPAFSISPSSVTLTGQTPGNVTVTSSGTQITYQAAVSYPSGDLNWLCVTNNGGVPTTPTTTASPLTGLTTPNTLTLTVCGAPANITTHTATVTLSATDSSGAVSTSFGVSYTVGSGGGGGSGSVVATPASVVQTIGYGGSTYATVYLTTSSTTPISFTLAGPLVNWVSWYQSSGNTGFVSASQNAILTVNLNGAGQSEASLTTTLVVNAATGTVNIPVTLNNGVAGSGGTSGTGTITVSPSTLQWAYSQSNPGAVPTPTTVSVYSTSGSVNYTATAQSSNGWLEVNGGYTTGGLIGQQPLTISGNTQLDALSPGTYTGTVTVAETDDNATATITVTATVTGTGSTSITINPSPIPLTASLNGATVQSTVTITSAVGGVLSATVTGNGISVSGSGQTVVAGAATYITVYGNPTGLANNTYVGTLNVSVAGSSTGAQINFVVGTGSSTGTGTNAAATPAQLNFYYETSSSMQASQTQQVYLSGSGNYTVTSSTTNTSNNWLSVSTTTNALPTTIYVTTNATGLAASTYTGQITITNSSTGATSVVNVSLLVQGITTIYAYPNPYEDLLFSYIANVSTVQQVQTLDVFSSDGTSVPFTATVANSSSTPWLTVSGSGNTPLGVTVTVNAGNLANGVYSGSITVSGGNNALTVPVVLTVTGSSVSSGTGPLTLGASALSLQAQVNGAATATTLSVSASTTTTVAVSSTVTSTSNGITWLSVSPFGTTSTPATVTITASPAGLPIGTYTGTVNLVANGSTQTVPVTFVVGTSGTGGSASVVVTANGITTNTSPSLAFSATALNQTLTTQTLSVTSAAGQSGVTVTTAVTTTSGGNWIQLNTTSGTQYQTPLTLTVTANTAGLAGGTYSGTITITPTGGTAVTVPVSLTIAGAPAITVSPATLTFAYQAGGSTPSTQTLAVAVSNASAGNFTATAASTPSGWLVASPASGTAPGNVTVSINPTGLTAGTYSGTITVAGSSPSTGSTTVNVSLTVTVPLPTITTVVNAASFVSEPISPGEIITIGGTNIGPATAATFTLTSIGGIQTVPSTAGLAGVAVTVNGYYAPILYVSSTQINAIVPYEVAGILRPTVLVNFLGQSSNGFSVSGAATAPGIFTANGSGTGPGAILNSDNTLNSASNAAARGTVVQVFLTGEGQTSPAGVDGKVTTGTYPSPLLPIAITVAGVAANYEFAGEAPGLVSGVLQLNVIIPPASSLSTTGAVPLVVSIGSISSQSGLTVSIK